MRWDFFLKKLNNFLADLSPIIGIPCHSLTDWLTDWLNFSCLVDLIYVTLACEDANSKLVEVVTIADVDIEDMYFRLESYWTYRFE